MLLNSGCKTSTWFLFCRKKKKVTVSLDIETFTLSIFCFFLHYLGGWNSICHLFKLCGHQRGSSSCVSVFINDIYFENDHECRTTSDLFSSHNRNRKKKMCTVLHGTKIHTPKLETKLAKSGRSTKKMLESWIKTRKPGSRNRISEKWTTFSSHFTQTLFPQQKNEYYYHFSRAVRDLNKSPCSVMHLMPASSLSQRVAQFTQDDLDRKGGLKLEGLSKMFFSLSL